MSAPTLSELIHFLQHGTRLQCVEAARLLAGYPEPQAIAALSQALSGTNDPDLHDIAVKSLGRMGPLAFQALVTALGDVRAPGHPRPAVRAAAAEALGKQKNPAAVEPLLLALKDAYPVVRKGAAGALIHYKEERTIEALKGLLLHDPDAEVRSRTASVLEAMGITAPVNIPTIITSTRPVTKPLPRLRNNPPGKKDA